MRARIWERDSGEPNSMENFWVGVDGVVVVVEERELGLSELVVVMVGDDAIGVARREKGRGRGVRDLLQCLGVRPLR